MTGDVYVSSSKQSSEQRGSGPVDPAPRPTRRSFTAEYKAAVVTLYETARTVRNLRSRAGKGCSIPMSRNGSVPATPV